MKKIYYIFFILIVIEACTRPQQRLLKDQINQISTNNIADKRLEYFNVEIKSINGKKELSGATVSEKAFRQLQTFAQKEKLDFNVMLLPSNKFKENPWAIVTLSVCNIRAQGQHSAELITQALMGTPVKVFQEKDGWYLIQTPDRYFGWTGSSGIALKKNAEMQKWKTLKKVLYKEQNGFAYAKANVQSTIEFDLVLADLLTVVSSEKKFYKIILPDGRQGFVKKQECSSLEIWRKKNINAKDVLTTAFKFKGIPYLWGGASAKMSDCSGFVKTAYFFHGLILQRDASQQTFYGKLADTKNGYRKLQPGDLVFFGRKASPEKKERITHVGMCIGNQEFIHESGRVHINSLEKNSDKYAPDYEKAFVRARRIIGHVDGKGIEWVVDNEFYKQILQKQAGSD